MSNYESIIIGQDDQESLYLFAYYTEKTHKIYNINNRHEFIEDYNNYKYIPKLYIQSFNRQTNNNSIKILKNDDYNFEECLTNFINHMKIKHKFHEHNNIFIRKNNKWYFCSLETHMILIPCEN